MKRALVLLAVLVLIALAAVDVGLWFVRSKRPATLPPPRPTAAATTAATASPTARPEPTAVPTIAPTEPPAAPHPTVVAGAKVSARTTRPPRKPRKPALTKAPPASPAPPVAHTARHAFVSGRTAIEGPGAALPSVPAGFDTGGVDAKAAPRVAAQIEFDVTPRPQRAGEAYAVRIYLRNEGTKTIKIRELRVGSSLNGARSESVLTPRLKEIPPEEIGLLAEIPSVWKADVRSWAVDAAVTSGHGEVYKNGVRWR